ncbi:MAG: glycosyltransferase family 4 protein [Planctomycetes bacterium]|nr:glycosyltransferase family 4 protein [Planctomycetota bacterium]
MDEQKKTPVPTVAKTKPLRLALVVSKRTLSEYPSYLKYLLVGLADESIPTTLICPLNYNVDSIVSPSIEIIRHPAFDLPILWRQNRNRLVERLTKFQPNVVHCLCHTKAQLTRYLTRQLSLPYLLSINSLQKQFAWLSVSNRRLAKIITPAKTITENFKKIHPGLARRIKQINIGTFTEDTTSCFKDSSKLTCMVTSHPLDNVNDFTNLLNAARHLAIDGYEFILMIVGSGRAEGKLRRLLNDLGLSQIVLIVPKLEPLRSTLAAGDIFIQPQPEDYFNAMMLEAMGVGTVVAACKGQVDDLIIDEQTSLIFDQDDELSVYNCLQRLLDAHDFARQLAAKAQKFLRTNHSVSKMITDMLAAYRDVQNDYFSKP